MNYLPDILAQLSFYPSGILFGFYFHFYKYTNGFLDNLQKIYPIIVGIICAGIIALFVTIKKLQQNRYTFDHFYILSLGSLCFLLSGLFLIRRSVDVSLYFGFAGHGITNMASITYLSIRSSANGKRPLRVALAFVCYFAGISTSAVLLSSKISLDNILSDLDEVSWALIGSSICLLITFVLNELLQFTKISNYKASFDSVWNYSNDRNILFMKRDELLAQFQKWPNIDQKINYKICKNQRRRMTILMLFIRTGSSMMFCSVIFSFAEISSKSFANSTYVFSIMLSATIGTVGAVVLLFCLRAKFVYAIFSVLQAAALIAVMCVFSFENPRYCATFFWIYYAAIGGFYSIPITTLLEISDFKYSEIIHYIGYVIEMILIALTDIIASDQNVIKDIKYLLGFGIIYSIISAAFIIIVLIHLLKSQSLITMRNELIGIREMHYKSSKISKLKSVQKNNNQNPLALVSTCSRGHQFDCKSNWKIMDNNDPNMYYNYGPKNVFLIPRVTYAGSNFS